SGVAGVDIALVDVLNHYWTGSAWTTSPCGLGCNPWQAASFVGNFSGPCTYTTLPAETFVSNASYRAYVRGRDRAGNVPADPDFTAGGNHFTVDNTVPASQTTWPSNNSSFSAQVSSISGTATDFSFGGSGVTNVSIRIQRSDGTFYDPLIQDFDTTPTAINFPISMLPAGPIGLIYTWSWNSYNPAVLVEGYQY